MSLSSELFIIGSL